MKRRLNHNTIGSGIYTIPDVAHILNLPVGKVSRWMREYWGSELEKKHSNAYYAGVGKDRTTNFSTLIEFYVFYQLREMKFGAKRIFRAHEKISKIKNTPYPFATVEILADPRNIFYGIEDEKIVNAQTDQIIHKELLKDFCKKIEFSGSMAVRYFPIGKDKHIVVDPDHQFGQPVIKGTNVLAENIFSMYESGESESRIGILLDVTENEIKDAISFCKMKAA